jgi:UPF0755 protein
MRKLLVVAFILLVLSGVGVVGYYLYSLKPVGGNQEKIFVVNRGEPTRSIASRLERQGLIRNDLAFLAYLRLNEKVGKIQAGSFKLSSGDSVSEIVADLQKGRIDEWITFVEGQRREEYADLLSENFNLPEEEFLSLTRGKEGRLFPDSYLLPTDVVVPQVVKKLTDNFQQKWQTVDNQTEMTENQVLILASLVEREAKTDQARKVVAGILYKRWQNDWPLQVDASVQYAKGNANDWWPAVTGQDLKITDSPYNTYLYKGLPPTPICNPSLSSIKAVVNYQVTDYWFYISDRSGKMHYAETIEEHNANIQKYLD